MTACAGTAEPPPARIALPDLPTHLRQNPGTVSIPRGPLSSREAAKLLSKLRKSELRHSRRGDQLARHYSNVRRAYTGNLRKAPK